jgi:hypothetical protein
MVDARRRAWAIDLVALGAIGVVLLSLAVSLTSRFVLDLDDSNLALAIEHFDVRMEQPQAPGYLGYVLVLRAVHALLGAGGGGALFDVTRWTSRAFALLTIGFSWQAARSFGADAARARLAALLTATNPILLYYAVDGQTHSAEAAMAAALLCALAGPRRPWLVGLLLAAGGSLRPTYLMLAGPAVLWAYFGDWRGLSQIAALALAGTLAWLLPTVHLTGGWHAYRAANAALVGGLIKESSLLSSAHDARSAALNLRDTLAWALIALLPLIAMARGFPRRVAWICAAMIVPALLFYALVICAEAGYLAGLIAPAAVLAALAASRRWPLWTVAAAQLAFFLFAPQQLGRTLMLPNVSEIMERDLRAGALFDAVHRDAPAGASTLVLSDFPDLTVMRQIPLVRPTTDVLFLHDARWFPAGGASWISYATRHGWHAAPGIVLRNDGDDRTLHATQAYERIALDPRASERLRELLRAQTRCPVAPRSDAELRTAQSWPRSCFGSDLGFYGRVFHAG